MPRSRSKPQEKPKESFFEKPPVEQLSQPVEAKAVEVKPVEVKREPTPQEVLSSILEELRSVEQLLVFKGEESIAGRIDVPAVFSGEVEVVIIDSRKDIKGVERDRSIVIVVKPLSEKALVRFNYKFYAYLNGKWEIME